MKRPSVLVSGNTTLDIITICDAPYNPSGKRAVAEFKQVPGGQAANVADLLARFGNSVSFVGAIGDDAAAQVIKKDFRNAGIEFAHSAFCKTPHHLGFVRVDRNNGERLIDMYRDPKLSCDSSTLEDSWVGKFSCIYIDSHEPTLAINLGKLGHKLRIPVVADLEAIDQSTSAMLKHVDILIAPGKIVSRIGQSDNVERATLNVLNQGFAAVVSTLGANGCIGISKHENKIHAISGIPIAVVDTTGAGDAFHGAFVHSMINGNDFLKCLKTANEIAAQKCLSIGPRIPAETAKALRPPVTGFSYVKTKWLRHAPNNDN